MEPRREPRIGWIIAIGVPFVKKGFGADLVLGDTLTLADMSMEKKTFFMWIFGRGVPIVAFGGPDPT